VPQGRGDGLVGVLPTRGLKYLKKAEELNDQQTTRKKVLKKQSSAQRIKLLKKKYFQQ
jgi:hypothetical protein